MSVYYNENDPFCVEWLKNLMLCDLIPAGEIDVRSIVEVQPEDLKNFTQCHFFAGIGGWPYALSLAGWDVQRPAWSGSAPCQPFSQAGKRKGIKDERHLWPEFHRLIAERKPPVVFGEQVASKDGRIWLAGVRADLEALGYAVGGADLCAAGIGAPHIRQRLYWVADAVPTGRAERGTGAGDRSITGSGGFEWLADADQRQRRRFADSERSEFDGQETGRYEGYGEPEPSSANGGLGNAASARSLPGAQRGIYRGEEGTGTRDGEFERPSKFSGMGNSNNKRPQGRSEYAGKYTDQFSPWASGKFIQCSDGKARRVEPGIFPLAHGISSRMGVLRGSGNAIVPQVAAEFIKAFMECMP